MDAAIYASFKNHLLDNQVCENLHFVMTDRLSTALLCCDATRRRVCATVTCHI